MRRFAAVLIHTLLGVMVAAAIFLAFAFLLAILLHAASH